MRTRLLQIANSFGLALILVFTMVGLSTACDGGGETSTDGQGEIGTHDGGDTDISSSEPVGEFGEIIAFSKVDYAEEIDGNGNLVFVTGKESGLHIFDIADPKSPTKLATVPMTKAWDVVASGTRAYVTDYEAGIHIVDVSNPSSAKIVGTYTNGAAIIAMGKMGANRVVVGGGDGAAKGWLEIIDVSTNTPKLVGSRAVVDVAADGAASSLAASGDTIFFGQADGTLRIFDAKDPNNIKQIGSYFHPGTTGHEPWGLGITVDGSRLYYSNWGAGIITLDVSSPATPTEISVFADGGYAFYDSFFQGGRLYIALDGGLGVLNMADPSQPTLVGGVYLSTKAGNALDDAPHGVWVHKGVAWVADNKAGMLVGVAVP